tara:strand:+ start:759 stop:1265 length:507 start_codon:yes stop_codon:yes gene_type:complete
MINVTLTPDCSQVIITVTNTSATSTNEILVSDASGSNTYQYSFSGGTDNTRIVFLQGDVGIDRGVFTVSHIVDGTTTMQTGFISACDILCCLAKKMEDLLDCNCECTKCAKQLAEAQKIYLLLKTAEAELATSGSQGSVTLSAAVIDNAERKYLTAQDMCAGHCGCNC